jgi:acyl-CoA synthetase (AMP-forming)/AMP-acid ligase II/acyl carrier protein
LIEQTAGRERKPERKPMSRLRWAVATGEALDPELCKLWKHQYSEVDLLNAYGPTECSDDVTHYRVPERFCERGAAVSIGRAIGNMRVSVLKDEGLRAAGIGVKGELFVGGAGVGRGYLNDPETTARSFVPDPLGTKPGRRLYRTGDAGRYRTDGDIEFLGRRDDQVKIRGFRIELGEIESALRRHHAVKDSAVAVHGTAAKRLVGYVVWSSDKRQDVETLRSYLKETLPEYMVPSSIVSLDALPLTSNGKLNRRALAAPEEMAASEKPFVPPAAETEQTIAAMWAEVLRLERVSVKQNFFDAGGHSLNATQVVSRIRAEFAIDFKLADFFAAADLEQLAQKVEEAVIEKSDSERLARLLDLLEGVDDNEAEKLLAAGQL